MTKGAAAMTAHALLVEVRLLDGRYHGVGDWPPSPFRLFQALVAGAYGGRWATEPPDAKDRAFTWLERLPPPCIAAPARRDLRAITHYVPNNDLDAVEGDPDRVADIRVARTVRPLVIAAEATVLYAWPFADGEDHAALLCRLADRLHHLGRGVDPAFAQAGVADWAEAEARLSAHGGTVACPAGGGDPARDPRCPTDGSLASLKARHAAAASRFTVQRVRQKTITHFRQPPKPVFRTVSYDRPPARLLYAFAPVDGAREFQPQPLEGIAGLAVSVRDRAAARLVAALGEGKRALVEAVLIGSREATDADKAQRVRLIPLPSIGHAHADSAIRRLLVEVPPDCPLPVADLGWAFAGLNLNLDPATGAIADGRQPVLDPAGDPGMLYHYGIGSPPSHRWHTITPVALPVPRRRGGIDGRARAAGEGQAAAAVRDALRHAGVSVAPLAIRVQREPWMAKGERAEAFATRRFAPDRLWHVAIDFAQPVAGPLVVGDGRYAGLGLMAPVRGGTLPAGRNLALFEIAPANRPAAAERAPILHAVRRALMSLARDADGGVPLLFSGHQTGPEPARPGHHGHVFLAALDGNRAGRLDRILVAAPWAVDRSHGPAPGDVTLFDRVVRALAEVRCGVLGVLTLSPADEGSHAAWLACARVWRTLTPYRPTRHGHKGGEAAPAVAADLGLECARRGLPRPEVEVIDLTVGPRGGISAEVRLRFRIPVRGPLLLGRDAHQGGGLFKPER